MRLCSHNGHSAQCATGEQHGLSAAEPAPAASFRRPARILSSRDMRRGEGVVCLDTVGKARASEAARGIRSTGKCSATGVLESPLLSEFVRDSTSHDSSVSASCMVASAPSNDAFGHSHIRRQAGVCWRQGNSRYEQCVDLLTASRIQTNFGSKQSTPAKPQRVTHMYTDRKISDMYVRKHLSWACRRLRKSARGKEWAEKGTLGGPVPRSAYVQLEKYSESKCALSKLCMMTAAQRKSTTDISQTSMRQAGRCAQSWGCLAQRNEGTQLSCTLRPSRLRAN